MLPSTELQRFLAQLFSDEELVGELERWGYLKPESVTLIQKRRWILSVIGLIKNCSLFWRFCRVLFALAQTNFDVRAYDAHLTIP